ncbi:hemolysin family protein [Lutispora saccharofermentans]|uniref:Hemolysin family protein n=1 Tax=Lutispora saccharofermentans TaxID=3024236 RepID=A0ABT1NIN4_9FIRM|nr:hemolysin family protein [Lutispora saccharofermentans]MCQ1530013.1 hemolysin family protein [Lutispora saccharofermentans]
MDGDLWSQMFVILLLIGINAFFAASEMAIVSIRQSKLKPLIEEGNKAAKIVDNFIEEPSKLLATIQVGITFAGFFASALSAKTLAVYLAEALKKSNLAIISTYADSFSFILMTLLMAYITLVLGELVPKRMALQWSDKVALAVAKPILFLSKIAFPIVKLLTFSTNFIVKMFGGSAENNSGQITEEEIRLMINVGEERGIIRETETEMINSIFEFDDTVVKEVMTPRTDIAAININASLEEILEVIVEEHFSRIPVYEDTIDNIVGLLYVKDLFGMMKYGKEFKVSLKDIIRPAYFVPEYKKIDELFKEMQKSKTHIAIVIDEYGGTAGLITIEDLLEEIVGNIFDEYDDVVLEYEQLDDNTYLINGMLSIDEVNDIMHTELPEDELEFDTISGMVLSLSGKMPEVGDEVEFDGVQFRIEEVDDKRITKIRIKKQPDEAEEQE